MVVCRAFVTTTLEAALEGPSQRSVHGDLHTIPELAAAYAEAIVVAHPLADGNMRSGFLIAVVFLGLNGFSFEACNESVVLNIRRLAAGELPWAELATWFGAQGSPPT
jgi:death-on-curing protein